MLHDHLYRLVTYRFGGVSEFCFLDRFGGKSLVSSRIKGSLKTLTIGMFRVITRIYTNIKYRAGFILLKSFHANLQLEDVAPALLNTQGFDEC